MTTTVIKRRRKLNLGRCAFMVYVVTMFGLLVTNLVAKMMYLVG